MGIRSSRSKVDDRLQIMAIDQCLINLAAKHLVPSLQVSLGVELHNTTGSQLMVDMFHKFGLVCSSEFAGCSKKMQL